eukprot:127687_1
MAAQLQSYELDQISSLKRKELQTLCKAHGIKANSKNTVLIKSLENKWKEITEDQHITSQNNKKQNTHRSAKRGKKRKNEIDEYNEEPQRKKRKLNMNKGKLDKIKKLKEKIEKLKSEKEAKIQALSSRLEQAISVLLNEMRELIDEVGKESDIIICVQCHRKVTDTDSCHNCDYSVCDDCMVKCDSFEQYDGCASNSMFCGKCAEGCLTETPCGDYMLCYDCEPEHYCAATECQSTY